MIREGKIWVANTEKSEPVYLLPQMSNRHGLIAGATGTGKTITLKVLAESFSDMGVPVFLADVKGDIAGMINPGQDSADMQERIKRFGLEKAGFEYHGYPVTLWDIYGKNGIQARTTITEMGPLLLSRILGLNDNQSSILSIVFKIADESNLALIDTKDLKSMLNYVADNNKEFEAEYGTLNKQSIGVIQRAVVALEMAGGDKFFGEPAMDIRDFLTLGEQGRGMIHILDSQSLVNDGRLYSTFLLWLLSELFETMPEVGDLDKPKMVFFFDEAHLLFNDTPKPLLDKIEQVVKLIRSKGVGVFFVTQNPRDIPDGVLAQLGNKVQHALHAYTPAEQKAVKAAADSFRENPAFKTADVIEALGTGEAVVSFLQEDGTPSIVEKVAILPPQSQMGGIDDASRDKAIKASMLYSKYANGVDAESAYELLLRMGVEKEQAEALAKEEEEAAKAKAKEEAAAAKAAEREKEKEANRKKRAAKSVGTTVAGTVGRELGKKVGKQIGGKFGQTLGGNTGAQLFRGILNTLIK
jgi:DNA helicase HerA-like ATPase